MTKTNSNTKGRHKSRHHNGHGHKHGMPANKNTVFDSNGPCGKLRGNVSQVIEKYQAAAKDAMTHGESVLAELCMQYADHYNRIAMTFVDEAPKKQPKKIVENASESPIEQSGEEIAIENLDLSIPDFSMLENDTAKLAIENA